jgi:hypothetical protein
MQFSQLRRHSISLAFLAGASLPPLSQVQASGAPAALKGWRMETVTDALQQATC